MLKDNDGITEDFAVRVYVSELSYPDECYDRWYEMMPKERRARADKFRNATGRRRSIASYMLLLRALSDLAEDKYISFEPFPEISEDDNGKPFFRDIPVCFNISHSGERVMVAVSAKSVGCDTEHKSSKALDIAKRFFSPEEYAFLLTAEDEEKLSAMFKRLWTLKESVVKCSGEGIRRPFDDFSLVDDRGNIKFTVRLPGIDETYHVREFEAEAGYCYSVCAVCDHIEDKIRRVSLS